MTKARRQFRTDKNIFLSHFLLFCVFCVKCCCFSPFDFGYGENKVMKIDCKIDIKGHEKVAILSIYVMLHYRSTSV